MCQGGEDRYNGLMVHIGFFSVLSLHWGRVVMRVVMLLYAWYRYVRCGLIN